MNKLVIIPFAFLTTAAAKAQTPNIVSILADDLGYRDISAFNPKSEIHTPNTDKLAKHGITFTDTHASPALSTPSRYSLPVGRHPWRTRLKRSDLDGDSPAVIDPERRTVAQVSSASGYNTVCTGKWHLGWDWGYTDNGRSMKDTDFSLPVKNRPTDKGFDYYFGTPVSLDISPYVHVENNKATPVPDHMVEPQKKDLTLLMRERMAGTDSKPEECFPSIIRCSLNYINEQKNSEESFSLYLPIIAPRTPILPSKEFRDKTGIGSHDDSVVVIDDMVRQVMRTSGKNRQLNNTIIVLASDDGCAGCVGVRDTEERGHFPSYIYRGYKSDIHEDGRRVPLIVPWKGKYGKETNNLLVSLVDSYTIFARMFNRNLKAEKTIDSYGMWPILNKKDASAYKDLVYGTGERYLSLRTSQLKLMFCGDSGDSSYLVRPSGVTEFPLMQLFGIMKDPSEKESIVSDKRYGSEVKGVKRAMKQYIGNGRSTLGEEISDDIKSSWNQVRILMQEG